MRRIKIKTYAYSAIILILMLIAMFISCQQGGTPAPAVCNRPANCITANEQQDRNTDAGISSCSGAHSVADTASYDITFSVRWSSACSCGRLPGGAHFTELTGTTHNSRYTMWRVGRNASPGVERLAETGIPGLLESEISAAHPRTDVPIQFASLGAVGTRTVPKTFNKTHPLLSLESMVAPTSDWFVGLSSYCLFTSAGAWKEDVTIPLRVYDAGTEQDNILFSLGNRAESPHRHISVLMGSAEAGFEEKNRAQYVGTIRLQKK